MVVVARLTLEQVGPIMPTTRHVYEALYAKIIDSGEHEAAGAASPPVSPQAARRAPATPKPAKPGPSCPAVARAHSGRAVAKQAPNSAPAKRSKAAESVFSDSEEDAPVRCKATWPRSRAQAKFSQTIAHAPARSVPVAAVVPTPVPAAAVATVAASPAKEAPSGPAPSYVAPGKSAAGLCRWLARVV